MKKGEKYIIEVEDVITDSDGKEYARIKGFNTLMFDDQGIKKLVRYNVMPDFSTLSNELAYTAGYNRGAEKAWLTAQRIAESDSAELYNMRLYSLPEDENLSHGEVLILNDYKSSYLSIVSNSFQEAADKIAAFDIKCEQNS